MLLSPFRALAVLTVYFAAASWRGLFAYFSQDDAGNLLNMHTYFAHSIWYECASALVVITPAYRPLGGIYYFVLYSLAGFRPFPFRALCLVLMLANVWLLFFLLGRLTNSTEAAFLGALLWAHHPLVLELLYSSGTIYEILCFLFYFGAIYCYFEWRNAGLLSWKQTALLIALTGCALDSKEMAMTLPAALLLVELIYFREHFSWRGPLASAALVVPVIAVKVLTSNPLSNDAAYSSHSFGAVIESVTSYQSFLLYRDLFGSQYSLPVLIAVWIGMAGIAILLRSRALLFGFLLFWVTLAPVCLIHRRGGYLLYLPAAAWALYLATLFQLAFKTLAQRRPIQELVLLVAAIAILKVHSARLRPYTQAVEREQAAMRSVIERLRSARPRLPKGGRILLVNDPLPPGYGPLLMARIAYGDPDIELNREKTAPPNLRSYDLVLREW